MVETKTKIAEAKDEEFVWKFRIFDISPVFKEVNSGIFKKVAEPNIYTCEEEHNDLADKYISEGLIQLYTKEEEPLRTPEKRYVVEDGRFILYESKSHIADGKLVWKEYGKPITDNFYMVLDEDIEFDDGTEKIHKWKGRIIVDDGDNEFKFDIDAKLFANAIDMSKLFLDIGGAKVVFDNNQLKDIRIAMQKTSKYEMRKVSQVFGWQSKKVYQSQSAMIFPGVVRGGDSNVDLSDVGIVKNLDIKAITDKEFKIVGDHICKDLLNVHERYPVDCLFGFTFLAPIESRIVNSKDWNGGRVGLWLVGGSGCGKTYAALLFQNFFGDFGGSNATFSWLGTPFSIQEGGNYFKDAVFMVDDFKIAHFNKNDLDNVVRVLQSYADGTSRTRFTNLNLSEGSPILGSLLITGEDVLDDVGSVMARYHVIEMNDVYKNRKAGKKTKEYKKFYSGFMGRYIAWLLNVPKRIDKVAGRIEVMKDKFVGDRTGANIDRVAQSFAYNLVGFEMFCRFLEENGFILPKKRIEMVKIHKNNLFLHIDAHVVDVKDATVSEIFINTLADLINSGSVKIYETSEETPKPRNFKDEYIGFDDFDEYLYFWGVPVWNAVNKAAGSGRGLMNSKRNLLGELVKRGIMVPGTQGNTFGKPLYGKTQATWRILKSALGYGREDMASVVYDNADVDKEDMEDW